MCIRDRALSSVASTTIPGTTVIISDPPKEFDMTSMDSTAWNQRYADSELVWSATPNIWVEQLTQDLPPGKALDIAAGEGRNALWLAARGWQVTAVDFSTVALQRARSLAEEQLGRDAIRLETLEADVETWERAWNNSAATPPKCSKTRTE